MLKRAMLLLFAILLTTAAPGRGADNGPLAHRSKQPRCVAGCVVEAGRCLRDARTTSAPCYQGCESLVAAARAACAPDPQSEACSTARAAAHDCLEPCNAVFRPAARTCLGEGRECVRACPFKGEPPCLAGCRADNVDCIAAARDAFQTCRSGCDDEFQAARTACATDPESDACTAARDALRTCLQPCLQGVTGALAQCANAWAGCIEGCGSSTTPQ